MPPVTRWQWPLTWAFFVLAGSVLEDGFSLCRESIPLSQDAYAMGGKCPVDDPTSGYIWQSFNNRTGLPDLLVDAIARAEPFEDLFGGVATEPVNNGTMYRLATEIAVALNVMRIWDIDQKTQTFKMHYILEWSWRDCRVLSSCLVVTVNGNNEAFKKFWRPFVRIKERQSDDRFMLVEQHTLWGHGWDVFTEEHVSTFHCPFNFSDMPFDSQRCNLTLYLPGTPTGQMLLWWSDLTSPELTNAEWQIQQAADWPRHQTVRIEDKRFGPQEMSQLVAEFTLTRMPASIVENYIAQAVIFYAMSWVGLWINLEAVPARAMVGCIPVLIVSDKLSALAATIPPISYPTRLQNFMLLTLFMVSLHMIEYGICHSVARFHERLEAEKALQQEASAEPHRCCRTHATIVARVHNLMEVHVRWLSPAVYCVAAAVILG